MNDFNSYLSPFTWRYASTEMRHLWSEASKRKLWRSIWLSLAEVQMDYGFVSREQVEDLRLHAGDVDVSRSLEIEEEIHHDLMAELKAFAEQCPTGGAILHLGATSMDIEDNADALRVRLALDLILEKLKALLVILAGQIDTWADTAIMAFTHLQPAEPSTLGYRLSQYGQDLLSDWAALKNAREAVKGKGFKGAVGTGAGYAELLGVDNLEEFEARLSERLGLPFYPVATQTYPRKQDYWVTSALAGLAGSLYKLAFDVRFLQSPPIGELSEPFGRKQVGSSAMPFKRNPITAEKIDSLARLLAQYPRLAWDNAAHSLLERTLDDSANRRVLLPEAFLIGDELLMSATRIASGLQVNRAAIERNLAVYGPFAATERVLMALVKAGADRQAMHERLRVHAMAAWDAVQNGQENPLVDLLGADKEMLSYLSQQDLRARMDASQHIGDAPRRARLLAASIRETVGS
ncbi:MAG: adenylosuccinate lyase [Chloroflexota bacterium]|nr:MAG: adenylosuccinate lyase [Chloroflexota bacterium]